jgi:hypothetical protein
MSSTADAQGVLGLSMPVGEMAAQGGMRLSSEPVITVWHVPLISAVPASACWCWRHASASVERAR